ncbi:MAG: phosphatase PAP2 family protein, partial [Candidatus Limnocylindria bacterium]
MTERELTNGPISAHRLMALEQPARAWRRALPEFAQRVDLDLFRRISRTAHPAGDLILPKLSHAANHSRLWMGMAAALAAFGGRFGKRAAMRGMLAVGAASFLSNLPAKLAFRRARPQLEVPIARRLARIPLSTSFPSGHAASAFAFATAVSIEKPQLAPVVFPLAGAVAYSRIYTGVHYPTDVVVGAAIGAGVAMATRRMWPATDDEPASTRPSTSAPTSSLGSDGLGLTVIVNPTAGSPLGADVAESLRVSLPKAKIVELSAEDDLSVALADAVESCAVLGIAGGDGSVNAAAAIAVEHETPLLVVPAGTLNHFARDLGINSVEDAISAVQVGSAAEVDVSSISGEVFVNTASVGAYVDMVEAREHMEDTFGK